MIARLMFAASALAFTVPAVIQPAPAQASVPMAERLIQMDHISVQVVGSGPPLILIPGLATPRAVWDAFVPELAKSHTLYLVQVNGFGGDDPRGNLTPGVLAGIVGDLHSLIASEQVKGAAVVGHSMGGLAGLLFAKTYPDEVGRLMVVDALPFAATMFLVNPTVSDIMPVARQMRDQIAGGYGKPPNQAVADDTAARLALTPDARAKVATWSMAADPRVVGQALYDDLTTDMRSDLATIRTPITMVYPFNSFVPKGQADAMYRGAYASAPQVRFVAVGDAAHFVMLDQPDEFRAALAAFLT